MQYRSTHPSGFALGICASILHTNLGSWLITITSILASKCSTMNRDLFEMYYACQSIEVNKIYLGCLYAYTVSAFELEASRIVATVVYGTGLPWGWG